MKQKRIAESLVHRHGTRDPFRIAQELGFVVIRTPLAGIRGFYQYAKRRHIIYASCDLPEPEARFVCAHELGHAVMHRGQNRIFTDTNTYFVTTRPEIEANRFAVDLLYDDDDLRFLLDYPVQLAADIMGVSVELAEYRLKAIN